MLTQLASKVRDAVEKEKRAKKLFLEHCKPIQMPTILKIHLFYQVVPLESGLPGLPETYLFPNRVQKINSQFTSIHVLRPKEIAAAVGKDLVTHTKKMQSCRDMLQSDLDHDQDSTDLHRHQ